MITYPRFWFAWLLVLVVVELIAVVNRHTGDTLSEYTWSKIGSWPMHVLLGALLFWLAWHFLFAKMIGLTWRDYVALSIGAAVGLIAFYNKIRA